MTLLWPDGTGSMPRVAPGDDSEFGMRWHPIRKEWAMHYGLDLIGWLTLRSPVDGVVAGAAYTGGWGNLVRIRADNGDEFWMAHCASMSVRAGQRVSAGQAVAVMGTTGNSTGVHLHYEVRPGGGDPVNPRDYHSRAAGGGGGYTPDQSEEDDMYDDNKHREVLTASRDVRLYKEGTGIIAVGSGGGFWVVPDENYLALLIAWEIAGPNLVARPIDKNELGALTGLLAKLNPGGDGEAGERVEAIVSLSPEDAKRIADSLSAGVAGNVADELAERLKS